MFGPVLEMEIGFRIQNRNFPVLSEIEIEIEDNNFFDLSLPAQKSLITYMTAHTNFVFLTTHNTVHT